MKVPQQGPNTRQPEYIIISSDPSESGPDDVLKEQDSGESEADSTDGPPAGSRSDNNLELIEDDQPSSEREPAVP